MTNPTPQDREMAEKLFDDTLSDVGRYAEWGTPSLREASIRDFTQAITTARLSGYRQGIEEAAKVAEPPLWHRKGKPGLWRVRRAAIASAIRALIGGEA